MKSFYEKYKKAINRYQTSDKNKTALKKAQHKYDKTKKGKKSNNKRTEKYNKNNVGKRIAVTKLNRLFIAGEISNNDFICAICGKQPIEKHHENYDLWYSFIPLCKKCHCKTYIKGDD